MATYKRQLWTSGYAYRVRCPYCGTVTEYRDNQLGYRSWYPNGFIYCSRCRKPLRHNEVFAVKPDGTAVYATQVEADLALQNGYLNAVGTPAPSAAPGVEPPKAVTVEPAPAPAVEPAPAPAAEPAPAPAEGVAFCTKCGRKYTVGEDHFCAGCGNKLD